jgi:Tfp pilus assembly protein FimT
MHLEGQYEQRSRPDAGYAMAVLLAGIAIMGVVWMLVVPVWKQQVQRE